MKIEIVSWHFPFLILPLLISSSLTSNMFMNQVKSLSVLFLLNVCHVKSAQAFFNYFFFFFLSFYFDHSFFCVLIISSNKTPFFVIPLETVFISQLDFQCDRIYFIASKRCWKFKISWVVSCFGRHCYRFKGWPDPRVDFKVFFIILMTVFNVMNKLVLIYFNPKIRHILTLHLFNGNLPQNKSDHGHQNNYHSLLITFHSRTSIRLTDLI